MNAGQIEIGRRVFAAPRDDHFCFCRFAQQGLQDRFDGQQLQVDCGVQLIEDHGFVEAAGDGGPCDLPGPLGLHVVNRLLLAPPDDGIAAGAEVVHQVRIALAKGSDGCIFGVTAAAFEPLQDQDPMALVLADAPPDGLQRFAQRTG